MALDMCKRMLALTAARLAAAMMLCAARPSAAQQAAGGVSQTVLRVAVDDSATGQPVSGARVILVSQSATRQSDELGRATFSNVPIGYQRVRVTALGYRPVNKLIAVTDAANGDSSATLIDLKSIAQQLDTVTTEATRTTSTAKLDAGGFDMRRKMGFGHFLDTDLIDGEAWKSSLGDMIAAHTPGIENNWVLGKVYSKRGLSQCFLDAYVDGIHQSDQFKLDDIDPGEVAGIEVYTMVEAPVQFKAPGGGHSSGKPDCGVLLLWTRM